jgi:hypothetical protein
VRTDQISTLSTELYEWTLQHPAPLPLSGKKRSSPVTESF